MNETMTIQDVREIKRAIREVTGFSRVFVEIASRADARDPEDETFDCRYWIEGDDALDDIDDIERLRKSPKMRRSIGMQLDCYVRQSRNDYLEGNALVELTEDGWRAAWD